MQNPPKKTNWLLKIVCFSLTFAWAATAAGLDMQIGGDQPLDLSSLTVAHRETFDPGMDPGKIFWGVLDLGKKENDPWTGLLGKRGYELIHTGRPGAVRYYFRQRLDAQHDSTLSEQALSVEVSGQFDGEIAGAGLLYAFDPETKQYLAFVKGKGNAYAIYQKNQDGLRKIFGGKSTAIHPAPPDQLAIAPRGNTINFYINGTHIATIKDKSTPTGAAGLIAISAGRFVFDNFTLYETLNAGHDPSRGRAVDQSGNH